MRIRSGAAPSAASTSASVLHSTSSGRVGHATRAACTAAPTSPPQSARWLSLIRIASSSARRWFVPPPVRTAYLARRRKPGSVFRVSRTTSCVPRTRSTQARVKVAIPQRCWRRLSESRSPARRARASPSSVASRSPATAVAPSAAWSVTRTAPRPPNTRWRRGSPQTTSRSLAASRPRAGVPGGTSASEVRSPAPRSSASARSMSAAVRGSSQKGSVAGSAVHASIAATNSGARTSTTPSASVAVGSRS